MNYTNISLFQRNVAQSKPQSTVAVKMHKICTKK